MREETRREAGMSEEKGYYEAGYNRAFERGKLRAYGIRGRVLDAGVGRGHSILELLRLPDVEVVSVDISEERLEQAQELLKESGCAGRVTFIRADLTALPFKDGEFDCAVSSNTLHHIPQWKRALEELVRVSREKVIIQEFTALGKRVLDSIILRENGRKEHDHVHDGVDMDSIARVLKGHGELRLHRGVLTDIAVLRLHR